MDGWTIYNEAADRAIYIGPEGDVQLSWDGQQTWQTVGKLTEPGVAAEMLIEMLGCKQCKTH